MWHFAPCKLIRALLSTALVLSERGARSRVVVGNGKRERRDMAGSGNPNKGGNTSGPARAGDRPSGIVAGGTGPSGGGTGASIVGSSPGPIGGTNAVAEAPGGESGIARSMVGPAGAPKELSQLGQDESPDDLGQESAQSTIKPNTTDRGEPQDRGP